MAELLDGAIEGFYGVVGAGEHDAAFHGDEDETGQGIEICAFGQVGRELFEAPADGGNPGGEVFGDELMGGAIFGIDFECQAAERAAVLAIGLKDASAIAGEDGEDAFNGVGCAGEGGVDDDGAQGVEISGEDGPEERFFAFEEVVEAAGVDLRVGEEVGHAGSGVASFPEEIAGGVDEPVTGGEGGGHSEESS